MSQVSIISITENNDNVAGLSQITLKDDGDFPISLSYGKKPSIDILSKTNIEKVIKNIEFAATSSEAILFLQPKPSSNLVFTLHSDHGGDWLVHQIPFNKQIVKHALLKNIGLITSVVRTNSGYAIGGISAGTPGAKGASIPLLIELTDQLVEQRRFSPNNSLEGELRVLGKRGNDTILIINTNDGKSTLGYLPSNYFSIEKFELNGGAATGAIINNEIIVSYVDKENYLWIEKFNTNFQSIWKTKILKRVGVGAPQFQIHKLKNGITLIGENNKKLTVVGVTNNGELTNIFSDKTDIGSPRKLGFISIIDESNINIFADVLSYKHSQTLNCNKEMCEFRVHRRVNSELLISNRK